MEEKTRLIDYRWHNTLEFLAGRINETNFVELVSEITKDYFNYFPEDPGKITIFTTRIGDFKTMNSEINPYFDDFKLATECLLENNSIDYGRYRITDSIVDECLEILCPLNYLNPRIMAKSMSLILNSDLSAEEKKKTLDKFYYSNYNYNGLNCLEGRLEFKENSLNYSAAKAIIASIKQNCHVEIKTFKLCGYSPTFIYDISKGISRNTETINLINTELSDLTNKQEILESIARNTEATDLMNAEISHSINKYQKFLFALLLGEYAKPKMWVEVFEEGYLLAQWNNREVSEHIKNNLVKRGNESTKLLVEFIRTYYLQEIKMTQQLQIETTFFKPIESITYCSLPFLPCAILALGEIGDSEAIAFLKECGETSMLLKGIISAALTHTTDKKAREYGLKLKNEFEEILRTPFENSSAEKNTT
jgi:hypothetical protein